MLIAQALKYAFGRMTLLARDKFVIFHITINDMRKTIQLGNVWRLPCGGNPGVR